MSPSIDISRTRHGDFGGDSRPAAIQHMWMTIHPDKWRRLVIRIFWDGEEHPSVEVPLGDFFCNGWLHVSGVQRRCPIDTRPNPGAGRPEGLYGNAFARAPKEQIMAATKALVPPTMSNILAMAAPAWGNGDYTEQEIAYVLNAAFTGFSAARRESRHIAGTSSRTVIHTGFWECGAFGGNRAPMTILQAMGGDLAGFDIVFWAFDEAGLQTSHDAYQLYLQLRSDAESVSQILQDLLQRRFQWGESDGN
jgi:hypothetical protein